MAKTRKADDAECEGVKEINAVESAQQQPKEKSRQRWEAEYRANPYLQGKPEEHVLERFRYLTQCITTLTETGQLGFETRERLMPYLWRRQTHMFVELGNRGGIPAHAMSRDGLPKISYPDIPAGAHAYRNRKRPETGELFKFSKACWLQSMLDRGSMYFSGAASFAASKHNAAIRDDELTFTYYPGSASPPLKVLRHIPGTDWMQIRHPSDFYLQCFTDRYALRMFDDFGYDACLVIYDAKEFGRRVIAALKTRFPDWFVVGVPVTYIDPDDPGDKEIFVPTTKHLRYIYQQEQRFICHPSTPQQNLAAVTIEVGPLTDIAELVQI